MFLSNKNLVVLLLCIKTSQKSSDGVGDQYHIALKGMLPYQGCPTRRYESTALCDLFAIFLLDELIETNRQITYLLWGKHIS